MRSGTTSILKAFLVPIFPIYVFQEFHKAYDMLWTESRLFKIDSPCVKGKMFYQIIFNNRTIQVGLNQVPLRRMVLSLGFRKSWSPAALVRLMTAILNAFLLRHFLSMRFCVSISHMICCVPKTCCSYAIHLVSRGQYFIRSFSSQSFYPSRT